VISLKFELLMRNNGQKTHSQRSTKERTLSLHMKKANWAIAGGMALKGVKERTDLATSERRIMLSAV
jgi:hypothetical protein